MPGGPVAAPDDYATLDAAPSAIERAVADELEAVLGEPIRLDERLGLAARWLAEAGIPPEAGPSLDGLTARMGSPYLVTIAASARVHGRSGPARAAAALAEPIPGQGLPVVAGVGVAGTGRRAVVVALLGRQGFALTAPLPQRGADEASFSVAPGRNGHFAGVLPWSSLYL